MHQVEVGGAKSTGLASFVPASFIKWLFVRSEAESRNFAEASRVLHLAAKGIKIDILHRH